ncbi:MAG: HEAT repeat domain-containing protein [Planctomycetota bacterium]
MKHVQSALAVMAIFMLSAWCVRAGDAGVDDLAKEFKGETPAQQRTPQEQEAACAKVLASLLPDMGSDDVGKQNAPQQALQRMAYNASRPGADAERAALAKVMSANLGEAVPVTARVWIIRQLEAMGRGEVVEALAGALKDKEPLVRETARRALQNNPAPEAGKILEAALAGADPKWTVAVTNALGYRKDTSDLPTLLKEAASDDDEVRAAAVHALALVGDKSATDAIAAAMAKGSDAAKRTATDAYLLLADKLAEKGDKDSALAMAKKMLAAQGHVKCAAIITLGRAGGAAEVNTILDLMNDPDVKIRGAGVEALNVMTSKEATKAIAEKVKTANPDLKVTLLRALTTRADKDTLPTFVAAAEDADENVKTEAVKGLAVVGDASVIPLLLKVSVAAGKPQEAARFSLDRLAGNDIDSTMIAALEKGDPKVKAELARSLAARRAESAVPALLKCAEDGDGAVRQEAWKALGTLADNKVLPQLVALFVKTQDADREEASKTVIAACKRDQDVEGRSGPILAAVGDAPVPVKLGLYGVLGRVGGQKALETLRAALKEKDDKVHDAAVRALAEGWPDAAAADDLLAIAKGQETETHQILAIRGLARVLSVPGGRPAAEAAKMLEEAMGVAKQPAEKKLVLGALGETPCKAALVLVDKALDEKPLENEASQAAVKIAEKIWGSEPELCKEALLKVLGTTKNRDLKNKAQQISGECEKKLKAKK